MNLQERIDLLVKLGNYLRSDDPEWMGVKMRAGQHNGWFVPAFTDLAVQSIASEFLDPVKLATFAGRYQLPAIQPNAKTVGLVMAGNIPLVGFHDWLCIFLCGHRARVKPSSRDAVLFTHLLRKMAEWAPATTELTVQADLLKGCDAYIATGSNNSGRYFDYYFAKYPHIIRRNRTSVAVLTGRESASDLGRLADDVHLYFGLGCRNATQLLVPERYDFVPMLNAFKKYDWFADHAKYKNNYDYQLAILLLNNKVYMSNGEILLVEEPAVFSPISLLHYQFYQDRENATAALTHNPDIQCIIGEKNVPFGTAQRPGLTDFADGTDTMAFLTGL